MSRCAYALPHHSDDLLEVYCGRPAPVLVCGYHFQRFGVPAPEPVQS